MTHAIPRPSAVADPTPWRVAIGDRSASGRASCCAAGTRAWDEGNAARSAGLFEPALGRGTIPPRLIICGIIPLPSGRSHREELHEWLEIGSVSSHLDVVHPGPLEHAR